MEHCHATERENFLDDADPVGTKRRVHSGPSLLGRPESCRSKGPRCPCGIPHQHDELGFHGLLLHPIRRVGSLCLDHPHPPSTSG